MRTKFHTRKLTDRQQEKSVFRPDENGNATIRCAFCEEWTDITRGIDGRIDMLSGSNVEVPSSQFDYTPDPDTLTQTTETRGLPRMVRGWICDDCASTHHAADLTPRKPAPVWRIGPSQFHNTPVQKRAAQKLQDYLDYCDLANVEPNPEMVWAITAVLQARRSYGFVKVKETLMASAGWAHTGQAWQSWHQSAMATRASVVDTLDNRKTRGKQSLTAYRPDDYHTDLGRIIDQALADARRIHWTPEPSIERTRQVDPFWFGVYRPVPAVPVPVPETPNPIMASITMWLSDTVRMAVDAARATNGRPAYFRPTFGESLRSRHSGAVVMAYRIGESPEPLPDGGCRHGLRYARACVHCRPKPKW